MEEGKEEVVIDYPIEVVGDEVVDNGHKLILTVVKKGFAYEVVKAASAAGGKGATILDGRGASETKRKFFGFEIAPEKEIVLMVVKDNMVYPIIKEIYAITGFKTNAKGTVFALPISFLLD